MTHYDVLIATPGNMIESNYVKSLVKTLAECDKRGITYKWLNNYSSLVHHARELTAGGNEGLTLDPSQISPGGKDITYNKIFWIDSDISWEVKDFFTLYDSEYDVSTGAYLLSDGFTTSVHEWGKPGGISPLEIIKMKSPMKVQSMGFGFLAVKSGVFEKIQRPWFTYEHVKVGETPEGKEIIDAVGEDISWCVKAYKAGVDIYFYPDVLVTHTKKQAISWDHIIEFSKTDNSKNKN